MRTVRFDGYATPDVLKQRYRLQMRGIYAGAIATKMIERKPVGDRADEVLVGPAVRSRRMTIDGEESVPVGLDES